MTTGAMYPGTFDPFTRGHEEIVHRAAKLFGRVVVAVAAGAAKQPIFDLDSRLRLIRDVVGDVPGVEVTGYAGLTVDFARDNELAVIVRGLRAVSDFEYEFQLSAMNRHLNDSVETVFLTPTEEYMFVSSSLVREIARMGGDVAGFVHPKVNEALRNHFAS